MNSKPTFERKVSVDRAEVAAQRLTNSHFQNPPYARVSIPRNQDDDDIVIFDFIAQAAAQLAEKERLQNETYEAFSKADDERERQWRRAEAAEQRLKEAQERPFCEGCDHGVVSEGICELCQGMGYKERRNPPHLGKQLKEAQAEAANHSYDTLMTLRERLRQREAKLEQLRAQISAERGAS